VKNAVFVLFSLAALSCATSPRAAGPPPSPCELLTAEDFGRAPVEVRASGNNCFFRMEPFNDSISLTFIPDARALWEKMEKRDEAHIREIEGVGDDALYSNIPVGATLYVRSGDGMLRISVGGKMSDAERLEKSVRLAKAALRRLR
jgi:hypothetical protein